jgi:hypothetical protein
MRVSTILWLRAPLAFMPWPVPELISFSASGREALVCGGRTERLTAASRQSAIRDPLATQCPTEGQVRKRPRRAAFIALSSLSELWSRRRDSNPQHQSGKVARAHFPASKCVVVLQGILLLFRQPKRAVEIILSLPFFQQAFGLEPFEVREVA